MLLSRIQLNGSPTGIRGFRVVAETFNAFSDLNESTELSQPKHFSVDHIANTMRLEEALPGVRLELLHAQRQATLLRLNAKHNGFYLLAFFQDFRRMLHALGPAQFAYGEQPVSSSLTPDESAKAR